MIKKIISVAIAVTFICSFPFSAAAAQKKLPKIDGSTSTIALDAAFTAVYTGADYKETLEGTKHSKTFESFEKLVSGEVDIVLSVPISDDQQKLADDENYVLEKEAVALEGFVFITNPENPVKSLTQKQLRDIYAGEITNWSEVGGDNAPIYAYQRNLTSGSQTYMDRFMGDTKMFTPPDEWYFTAMGHLVEAVSDYPTSKYAIGYSVYSYAVEELAKQKNLHLVAVDGITPEKATFENGSYPLVSYTYAYYGGNTADKQTLDFIDFMLSDNGQKAAADAGYIPVRNIGAKPYSAKGTGEVRPKNRTETREYSSYEWISNELDGVLENSETEKKINAWLSAQEPLPVGEGIYFEAINGYLNVYYGVLFGESPYPSDTCVISCWNLKTGKRLEKFTDLFYKDSDFVPALNRALGMYFNEIDFIFTGEPKNFNVLTLTDINKRRQPCGYGEDEKEEAQNALGEIYKEMPAWDYFDMKPLFTDEYKSRVMTNKVALWTEQTFTYEKLLESRIYYSRFIPQAEIERRNIELEKLYNIIEQSEEYKNYDYSTDYNSEFDEPIVTEINFSEDGNITYIWTPFGEFTLNRKTGKYKTPSNDFIMKNDVKFIGYIDFDFDGTPETVTLDKSINVYNEKWELVFSVPYVKKYDEDGYNRYEEYIEMWKVARLQNVNANGEVVGVIVCDEKIFSYIIENGVAKLGGDDTEIICILDDESMVYAAGAVDYPDYEYVSGKAEADFIEFQNQSQILDEKADEERLQGYFALMTIQNGKRYIACMSWAEDILYINGKANKSDAFPCYDVEVHLTERHTNDYFENPYEVFLSLHYGGMYSHLVPVFFAEDDSAVFPVSEDGLGQGMIIDENNIILTHRTYDITPDGSSLPGGTMGNVTQKDYWFYKDVDTFTEYGAVPITEEAFKTIKGSDKLLKTIADDGAKITGILYRSNHLININATLDFTDFGKNYTMNVNYTAMIGESSYYDRDEQKTIYEFRIINDKPTTNAGVYLPSILETIGLDTVVYPGNLPGKE
jgi:ABC-type phosphate transport system substrate-binding protein